MARNKELDRPKRFNAVVNQHTYEKLVTLVGKQTMVLGRPYSLAELVRSILENAVSGNEKPYDMVSGTSINAKEMQPVTDRQPAQGKNDE